jgi:type VI secretion system secreted protein Hcp
MKSQFPHLFGASYEELARLAANNPTGYAESILEELGFEDAIPWQARPSPGEAFFSKSGVGAGEAEAVPTTGPSSINLFLRLNNVSIAGEPLVSSLGRQNSIECLSYQQGVVTAREAGSGAATGRRQYAPIVIRKRIDKSSPLLAKGLTQNEVAEGTFKFYRPNPNGDGTTEQYYTVDFQQGRLSAFKQSTTDGLIEEVAFVFQSISWTFVKGGIFHQDTWSP